MHAAVEAGRQAHTGRAAAAAGVARAALPLAAAVLLIGALNWPMLFTRGVFNIDWLQHLWLLWKQSLNIRENGTPSFFLNHPGGVFYPEFAFYGGTLYALLGGLSLLLGDAPIETYVLAYLLGFVAAYGGWYWLGRLAGLGRWWAQVPGVIFITAAYYLTLIYARGDQPEFLAVSAMPLLIAAALSVLLADRLRLGPALALVLSGVVFCGSHSLTLIWGTTLLAVIAGLVLVCIPEARRMFTSRGVARVACLLVPALLLSAWYLLPAIAYESHTHISQHFLWGPALRATMPLVSVAVLFALSRASATTPAADFVLSLPVLAIAWSLVAMALCLRRGLGGAWTRLLLICAAMTVLVTIVMTHAGLILALPGPYSFLQFAYRLESYVALCLAATVLVGLALLRRDAGRASTWAWMIVPVLIVAVVGALQQVDAISTAGNRDSVVASSTGPPPREADLIDYIDVALPLMVDPRGSPPEVDFSTAGLHDDRASVTLHLPPRELVYSNLAAGPEFLRVTGARIVGIYGNGDDVLEIGPSASSPQARGAARRSAGTEHVSVSLADGLPIVAGRLVSLAALAFLVGLFAWLGLRGPLARRAAARARLPK